MLYKMDYRKLYRTEKILGEDAHSLQSKILMVNLLKEINNAFH